jgi:AcrR family transcriptional regulator
VTRRDEILAAAAQLFADRGYDSVGMDELGASVGMTGPALYYYFPGKAQLLTELLLPSSEQLAENASGIVQRTGSALDAISQLIYLHVRFVVEHPSLAAVYAHELRNLTVTEQQQIRAAMREYLSTWAAAVSRASPCLDLATARALLQGIFAMVNGVPLGQLEAAGRDVPAFLSTMVVSSLSGFVPGLADYRPLNTGARLSG